MRSADVHSSYAHDAACAESGGFQPSESGRPSRQGGAFASSAKFSRVRRGLCSLRTCQGSTQHRYNPIPKLRGNPIAAWMITDHNAVILMLAKETLYSFLLFCRRRFQVFTSVRESPRLTAFLHFKAQIFDVRAGLVSTL
jgi:hypothetical protein